MSQIWLPELIIKDSYLNNYLKKLSCQAYCFNFQSNQKSLFCQSVKILLDFWIGIVNLKNVKYLSWWNFCMSEDGVMLLVCLPLESIGTFWHTSLEIVQNLCGILVILTHKDLIWFKNLCKYLVILTYKIIHKDLIQFKQFFLSDFYEANAPKYTFESV